MCFKRFWIYHFKCLHSQAVCRYREKKSRHLQNQTSGEVLKKPFQHDFPMSAAHSSKPAQGKVVDSCQFRGVWRCLLQLGSSPGKDCRAGAASPLPLDLEPPSPSQSVSRRVERCHLTMEMGLPSLPASFWADLKVCVPGLENLPYPKSRLKPTAAFQALPGKTLQWTRTHAHTLTWRSVCSAVCIHTAQISGRLHLISL